MKLLVVGGGQRENAVWSPEWKHYERALVYKIDLKSEVISKEFAYISPQEVTAGVGSNIVFKAAHVSKDRIYLCTQTEILIASLSNFDVIDYISLECFNDIHHVYPLGDKLYVVSTGLDMVVELDEQLRPQKYINILGEAPWARFDKANDYRKVVSTQPHLSHPNFCFDINGDPWVTRFRQKDAISLYDQSKKISIGENFLHDGIVRGEKIYFTSVDGCVHIVDKYDLKVEKVINIQDYVDSVNPLGWCRAVELIGNDLYIGFSALRSTKFRQNLSWVKRGFKGQASDHVAMPTRIVRFDLEQRAVVKEYNLQQEGMDAVFSIHAL